MQPREGRKRRKSKLDFFILLVTRPIHGFMSIVNISTYGWRSFPEDRVRVPMSTISRGREDDTTRGLRPDGQFVVVGILADEWGRHHKLTSKSKLRSERMRWWKQDEEEIQLQLELWTAADPCLCLTTMNEETLTPAKMNYC